MPKRKKLDAHKHRQRSQRLVSAHSDCQGLDAAGQIEVAGIERVTIEDVKRVAREVLAWDRLNVTVVGMPSMPQ